MSKCYLLESPEIIQGIGPAYGERLAEAGIGNIGMMFRAGPAKVHVTCTGSGKKQVGNWFCSAALLRIHGMTPNTAELLVRAGIRSVRKVARTRLETLESELNTADPDHPADVYALARLQQSASEALDRGLLIGRILTKGGDPVPAAKVSVGEFDAQTDQDGWFGFDQLPARTYKPCVYPGGRPQPLRLQEARIEAGRLYGPVVVKVPDAGARPDFAVRETCELDGNRIVNTRSTLTKLKDKPLAEFRPGTLFEVRKVTRGKANLLSLYLVKLGFTIFVERADAAAADLPPGSEIGNILLWNDSKLELTNYTRQQVTERKRDAAKANRTRRSFFRISIQPGKGVIRLG